MPLRSLERAWNRLRIRPIAQAPARPLDINDLLGRRPVNLDTPELQRFLAGKRVLVTGAGGSIGSEICRQTMKFCPDRLILLDRAENAFFEIDRELRERWVGGGTLEPSIADVCDVARVRQVFEQHQPQVVFHAAAHKHVPMMERHPGEAVKNNIFGTKNVADAALEFESNAFVLISTDKAVNPSSVMGASKRVAELYVQGVGSRQLAVDSNDSDQQAGPTLQLPTAHYPLPTSTRFLSVRFGNVLGSSGSVVPIFERQIAAGGPVTVTHPDMKRYFMTIPEASQLVMQAGAIGKGGEIFLLDMGEPVRILDLATEMIRRRGLVIGKDIELRFSGIRPGEKLYEELSCADETTTPTTHPKIHVWRGSEILSARIDEMLIQLRASIGHDREVIIAALSDCVAEYQPQFVATPELIRAAA